MGLLYYYGLLANKKVAEIIPVEPSAGEFSIPVTLTISGDTARVIWKSPNYQHNSYKIERRKSGGSWVEVESAFSFSNPMNSHSDVPGTPFSNIFPYLFYEESGLTSGGAYEYQITGGGGQGVSNPVSVVGTNYYIKNGGNDGANGLSDATAWATLNKVKNASKTAGDAFLFKRGDTFNHAVEYDTWLVDGGTSGTANNPIKIGAYSTGAKPIINVDNTGVGIINNGLMIRNASYWHLDNLRVVGARELAQYRTITLRASQHAGTGITYYGLKVLNCDVICTGDLQPDELDGAIFMYEDGKSQNTPDQQYSFLSDVEVGFCYVKDKTHSTAIRFWSCKEYGYAHSNFLDNCAIAGITISGGYRHLREWNMGMNPGLVAGTSGTTFGKTNSQGYYGVECMHRYEFGYGANEGGFAFEELVDSCQYYCTGDALDGGGYTGTFHTRSPGAPSKHMRNIVVRNIFTGDLDGGGEGCWVDYNETPADELAGGILINDNVYYNYDNVNVINNKVTSTIITPANFNTNWVPNHPGDKYLNPQYTNRGSSNPIGWIPQNSTAQNYGRFVSIATTQIILLGSIISNEKWDPTTRVLVNAKNEIAIFFDKDLNENFNSTSVVSVTGKTVTATRVYRNKLYITVNSNFTQGQSVFFSYSKPAAESQTENNTLQDIFGNLKINSFTDLEVDLNGIY